ncbi:hypothetical protein BX666DRAFT_2012116 [Dichotomocladium elegans]|nr:hypothetical protein BX666DRAFT_2012116 [Dichotomocladium elegans]
MHNPPVVRLQIPLPSEQYVTFHALMSQEQFDAVRQMAATGTTLLGFFALCAQDEFVRTLCYSEIANSVPRIYSVGLSNMPLYCLRLLLLCIPGSTSFAALLANGDDAPTRHLIQQRLHVVIWSLTRNGIVP